MFKTKSLTGKTKETLKNNHINDILEYNRKFDLEFSDLDKESQNKLIKEISDRILGLEQQKL